MSTTLWMNRDTVMSVMSGYDPIFLLSHDTPDALRVRAGRVAYVYNANYWWYHTNDSFAVQANEMLSKAPTVAHAVPAGLSISETGRLVVLWSPVVNETIYPKLDGVPSAAGTAPIQSFMLVVPKWMNGSGVSGLVMSSADARPWIVGSVGEKGSGADLELEGISEWKHGRPLYLPGNKLELPIRILGQR